MKKALEPQEMINDLQHWVTAKHEDQVWSQHESLYLEILAQWKAVNRYRPEHGTDEDQRLYRLYWSAMNKWHQSFAQQSEDIFEATPLAVADKAGFYHGVLNDLMQVTLDRLPKVRQAKVVQMNDFINILNVSLNDMQKLSLDDFNVIDISLLLDYWQFLGDALKQF